MFLHNTPYRYHTTVHVIPSAQLIFYYSLFKDHLIQGKGKQRAVSELYTYRFALFLSIFIALALYEFV